jgi:hypothetical protein
MWVGMEMVPKNLPASQPARQVAAAEMPILSQQK